jgi:hypothetical protein
MLGNFRWRARWVVVQVRLRGVQDRRAVLGPFGYEIVLGIDLYGELIDWV